MLLIGDWTVHRELDRLTQQNEEVHITPKAMDVLIHLADNQGKLVTKEALLNKHWRGAISGDNAVHKTMAELRRVFGDNPRNPSYIETFPKRGYLLIADVQDTLKTPVESYRGAQIQPATTQTHQARQTTDQRNDDPPRSVLTAAAQSAVISVLPFLNLAKDPLLKHFGEGVAEEITNALGRSGLIRTISHSASIPMISGTTKPVDQAPLDEVIDPVQLGKLLNVTHVLEGAVRRDTEMIRITAQLLDTKTGIQCAAKRFDYHVGADADFPTISTQEDIALPILELLYDYFEIRGQLRPISRRARSPDQSYLNDIFDH